MRVSNHGGLAATKKSPGYAEHGAPVLAGRRGGRRNLGGRRGRRRILEYAVRGTPHPRGGILRRIVWRRVHDACPPRS